MKRLEKIITFVQILIIVLILGLYYYHGKKMGVVRYVSFKNNYFDGINLQNKLQIAIGIFIFIYLELAIKLKRLKIVLKFVFLVIVGYFLCINNVKTLSLYYYFGIGIVLIYFLEMIKDIKKLLTKVDVVDGFGKDNG